MFSCMGCLHVNTNSHVCTYCIDFNNYEPNGLTDEKPTDISKEMMILREPIVIGGYHLDLNPFKAVFVGTEDLIGGETNMQIKKVIFNYPVTVVLWEDDTKTIVRCGDHDVFDPEKGLAMAIAKKALGNTGKYYDMFKKWVPKEEEKKPSKPIVTDVKVEEKDGGLEVKGTLTEECEVIFCKDCVHYTKMGSFCKRYPDWCFTCYPKNSCQYAVKREPSGSGE